MYYMLNNFIFIRPINNYLKIWNKLNYNNIIGDLSSYLFLKHLDYFPKKIEIIASEILSEFASGCDLQKVKDDAISLFAQLENMGIVATGKSADECFINAKKYSSKMENKSFESKLFGLDTKVIDGFGEEYGKHPVIQGLIIEITQICNERCVHCYIPHEQKNIRMEDTDFYKIIDECKNLGTVVDIKISGGECITHPSFKKYISYVKKAGFALTVMTNLTLLNDEIINILKEGTLSKVQVSLFSLRAEVHDKITTITGSLSKVLKNLERLYDANIPVCIATKIMESNKNEIEDIYKYVKKHNFEFNLDWTIMAQQNGDKQNLVERVKDVSFYRHICSVRCTHEDNFKSSYCEAIKAPLRSPDSSLCSAGMNLLHISTNLDVHPCAGWMLKIGNLKEQSLQNIWETSKELQKVRNITLKDFPKCSKCDNRNVCTICMAQTFTENDNHFEVPEYTCEMYKIIGDSMANTAKGCNPIKDMLEYNIQLEKEHKEQLEIIKKDNFKRFVNYNFSVKEIREMLKKLTSKISILDFNESQWVEKVLQQENSAQIQRKIIEIYMKYYDNLENNA